MYKFLPYHRIVVELVLGILFMVFGGWAFISPKSALDFKVAWAKKFGIKMTPSKKTYKMFRYVGLVLLAIGIFILL